MTDPVKSSPLLAALILSDPGVADSISELKRQNLNAYERIEDLQNAIRGLLGLIQIVADRRDVSRDVSQALSTSQRVFDAKEILR